MEPDLTQGTVFLSMHDEMVCQVMFGRFYGEGDN